VIQTTSVVLCTHNGARFIREQLESILAGTILPDEIVVSDDASTDDTLDIVDEVIGRFRAANTRSGVDLRILRNPVALGVVRNFEQAVTAATGRYIVLSDQDDRWSTSRIAVAAAKFAAEPDLLLLFSDARLVDASGHPLGYSLFDALAITEAEKAAFRSPHPLAALLARNVVTGATTAFRRDVLSHALPFPSEWVHDEWIAAIAAATGRIDYAVEQLIDYRQHGNNAIGATKIGMRGRLQKLREPREERNRLLVGRAGALVDRLGALGDLVQAAELESAQAKLEHERARLALPAGRVRRVGPVVRELRSGGYSLYGRGMQDVLRDLVQPAR
jgi:glycosyltransferase involved in cell wall biosynthesis